MPKKEAVPETLIRILKIGSCLTLSGQSEVTYQIGCHAEDDIHVRVVKNSSSGRFNADWVPLARIEKLLSECPADKPVNSLAMRPVFKGKSSNSPAFLFAVLVAEGLVHPGKDKDSGYVLGDLAAVKNVMTTLVATAPETVVALAIQPEPQKKKRPVKDAG